MFVNRLSTEAAGNMVRNVQDSDIKSALFAIGNDKAPSPDGFTAAFIKSFWEIVGPDVCAAIK